MKNIISSCLFLCACLAALAGPGIVPLPGSGSGTSSGPGTVSPGSGSQSFRTNYLQVDSTGRVITPTQIIITTLVVSNLSGSAGGLSNASPRLATNSATATDGQVLVKRGNFFRLETPASGGSSVLTGEITNAAARSWVDPVGGWHLGNTNNDLYNLEGLSFTQNGSIQIASKNFSAWLLVNRTGTADLVGTNGGMHISATAIGFDLPIAGSGAGVSNIQPANIAYQTSSATTTNLGQVWVLLSTNQTAGQQIWVLGITNRP